MADNSFAAKFSAMSNAELLAIIEQPEEYLTVALEIARHELDSRNLDATALAAARREMEERRYAAARTTVRISVIETQVKQRIARRVNSLITWYRTLPKGARYLNILLVALAVQILITLYSLHDILLYMSSDTDWWSLLSMPEFLSIPVLIIISVYLWKRAQTAWTMLMFFIIIGGLASLCNFCNDLYIGHDNSYLLWELYRPEPESYFSVFLLHCGMGAFLAHPDLRKEFGVNKRYLLQVVLLEIVLALTFILVPLLL